MKKDNYVSQRFPGFSKPMFYSPTDDYSCHDAFKQLVQFSKCYGHLLKRGSVINDILSWFKERGFIVDFSEDLDELRQGRCVLFQISYSIKPNLDMDIYFTGEHAYVSVIRGSILGEQGTLRTIKMIPIDICSLEKIQKRHLPDLGQQIAAEFNNLLWRIEFNPKTDE